MGMITFNKEGETPLDDISGLKLKKIATRAELDDAEAQNILKAYIKYTLNPLVLKKMIFNLGLFLKLHKDMFGDVWSWAGKFRMTQTSIGVDAKTIHQHLYQLQDNLQYWEKEWNYQEGAVRLHHTLVKIHPFPNGNGRWARLVTDLWLLKMSYKPLSWGGNITQASEARFTYIAALKEADQGNYGPLRSFMFNT
jgi:Fic-DOC domain mobile mystery protein B